MNANAKRAEAGAERDIFLAALEKTNTVEQVAFVHAACGKDEQLRNRVEALLREHQQIGAFLDTPALAASPQSPGAGPGGTRIITFVTEKPGDRIGRYKLLQKIGEGGAGVVYMAEQEEPVRRRVALKVIKLGMDTRSVIARFEAERQALAMMDHPSIAKVLDAGATETGGPYFVMELVRGIKITDYADQNKFDTNQRLALFIQVCLAIQDAHQKGIIHRDIKPSNVLVTLHDGLAVPKVIDFGIAKATNQVRLTDRTIFTAFEEFIGTPAYMSPEQAEMSGLDIDTRSDIYSLGVLLYELLTGKTPFDAENLIRGGLDECRRTLRMVEPARPSTRLQTLSAPELTTAARARQIEPPKLIHLLQGELDWVAMKCLEKDRTRRYATANDLAMDVQRYLSGESILARPPSHIYRLQKLAQRNRTGVIATSVVLSAVVFGASFSIWQAIRAVHAEHQAQLSQKHETELRHQAETEKNAARVNEYIADINLAQQSIAAGNLGRAFQLLQKHQGKTGAPDLRGFEWRYLWSLCQGDEHSSFPTQNSSIEALALSPEGKWLAAATREQVTIYDAVTRTAITNLRTGANSLGFSPDGKRLVAARPDAVQLWSTRTWTRETELADSFGPAVASSDHGRMATSSQQGVSIWDTETWKPVTVLKGAHGGGPLAFTLDGKRLATQVEEGVAIWNLANGGEPARVLLPDSTNLLSRFGPWFRNRRAVAFSPDGKKLAAARNLVSSRGVFVLSIWDVDGGNQITMPADPQHIEHSGAISALEFSADGQTLATASWDYSIKLWDLSRGSCINTFHGHHSEVWSLTFAPDGQNLITGAKDGTIFSWPIRKSQKDESISGDWQPLGISQDGKRLAAVAFDTPELVFFDLSTRAVQERFPLAHFGRRPPPHVLSLSQDFRLLARGKENGTIELLNTDTRQVLELKSSDGPVPWVTLSPNGYELVAGGFGHALRWWDLKAGTNCVLDTDAEYALFSGDSKLMALFGRGNGIQLWDVQHHTVKTNFVTSSSPGFAAAFSPDGSMLAIAAHPGELDNSTISLVDTMTGQLIGRCIGHKQSVFSLAFSPDGHTLASAGDDSTLKLWNIQTQQELLTFRKLGGAMIGLAFSADGKVLIGRSGAFAESGAIQFLRAPAMAEIDRTSSSSAESTMARARSPNVYPP